MSADELVVSPEVFPSIRAGDLLFMWDPALSSATSSSAAAATAGSTGGGAALSPSPPPPLISARRRRRREQERGALLLAVSRLHGPPPSAPSVAPAKGSGFAGNLNYMNTLQVSLSNKIADLFGFVQRQAIAAEVLTPETAPQVDFVEVVFRDQYVGRSDMWRLQLSLIGSPIYIQKPISFSCIRATVSELLRKGKPVRSGFVTRDTKFVFRSRSAKFYLLIQMSSEMWDFAEDGELYFEKVNLFLRSMFSKWKASSANHTLCLVLFSRLYLAEDAKVEGNLGELQTDSDGLQYRDFYKVLLLDEKKSDWESVILQLKREFIQYPRSLRWDPHADGAQPCHNSTARKGNLLEAINLALLDLDKDFIDRDLKQTGQGIVAISGGSGHFEVCAKMMQMTKQKIIDHGIGCDLICLSKPPLHMVPLFECRAPLRRASSATGGGGGGGTSQDTLALSGAEAGGVGKLGFNTPHWIYISFFNPRASSAPAAWEARCRMPQLQYHYSTNVLDELRCGRTDAVVTVKSGAAVCGVEEARKERREDPRLDDAYFDSYDSSVFSPDDSPALSSFPGKHSLGRDAIGPFGPRKQHHPNANHHHHHHPKSHRPLHPPNHLAEAPESYQSTTPGTDPFLSTGSDTAMKPVRLPYAHPHGNHEDGNNAHAGANSSKDPPNRDVRDQSQSQSSVKTTPHPRSATTSANTTTASTASSGGGGGSTGVTAAIAITSATSATMTAIGTTAAPSTGPSPGSASASVRRASVAIPPPSTLAGTGSALATAAPQSSAQLPPHSNAAAAAAAAAAAMASLKVSAQGPPAQHVPPPASLKAKFKKTNACLNPFQPLVAEGPGGLESDPEGYSSNKRRWSHLFHTSIYRTVGHKEYTYAPNWKSLCEPASLPITTDYKPTPSELNTRFAEGNHTLNADDAGPYRSRTEELLRELVSQRLVQGYQLVVPPKPRKDLKPQKPHPKEKPGAVSSSSSDKSSYTVSMGNDYHEFAKEGQNIRVKRYHKKDDRRIRTGGAGIVYSYQLMGLGEERWAGMRVSFNHKASAQYSWNYLDQLICGYSDDMYDTLKYSTVKYVLAPVQTADVEERAVRSFLAFAKALAAKEDSKLNVQILSKFAMVDDSESKERPARMKPDEVDRILGAMRHPISGLTPLIRDRRWRFRNYKSCFVGSDCVDWLLKNVDIENRRAAEELGQRILELGFVEHVAGKAHFKDGNYYYRLHEDSPTATLPANLSGKPDSPLKDSSPSSGQQQKSASLLKKQLAEYVGSAPPPGGPITPPATPVASRSNTLDAVGAGTAASLAPPVVLGANGSASPSPQQGKAEQKSPTHTLKIEIPLTKTDRYEWLYMVYDGVYNPYEWFHVEFQWLVCTGCVVDDFLSMLERKAKNLGLRWIPIPVYLMDRSKKTNGFMGAFEIPLACSVRDLGTMVILQQEILALCDFLLDKASGDQYYIHKTGMLFAQITCEGFLCSLNTLPGARHKLGKGMKMLQYLRDFCTDAERVEALLGQLLNPRMSPRSFDDRDDDLLENETDGEDSGERQPESDRQKLRQPAPVMAVPKKGPIKPARVFSLPGPPSPTMLSSAVPSSSSWVPASSPSHTASVGPLRHHHHQQHYQQHHQQHHQQQQQEPSASPPSSHHPRPALGVPPLAPPAAAAESAPAHDDSSGEGSSSYNALLYYCVLHRGSTGGGDGTFHQPLAPAVDVSARWRSLNFLPAPGLST